LTSIGLRLTQCIARLQAAIDISTPSLREAFGKSFTQPTRMAPPNFVVPKSKAAPPKPAKPPMWLGKTGPTTTELQSGVEMEFQRQKRIVDVYDKHDETEKKVKKPFDTQEHQRLLQELPDQLAKVKPEEYAKILDKPLQMLRHARLVDRKGDIEALQIDNAVIVGHIRAIMLYNDFTPERIQEQVRAVEQENADRKKIAELEKENSELKKENEELQHLASEHAEENEKLKKEKEEQAKMIAELQKMVSDLKEKNEEAEKRSEKDQARQHQSVGSAENANYKRKFEMLASGVAGEATNRRSLVNRVNVSDAEFQLDIDALLKDKDAEAKASAEKSVKIKRLEKEAAKTEEKIAGLKGKLKAAKGGLKEEKSKKVKEEMKALRKAEEEIKLELKRANRLAEKKEKKIKRLEAVLDKLGEAPERK
jgi:hypothetical protein